MHPIGWCIKDLHRQSRAGDDEPGQKHDEKGGPVSGVGKREIEAALLAARAQRKKTPEEMPLAAGRTTALEPGGERRDRCFRMIRHSERRTERNWRGNGAPSPEAQVSASWLRSR